MSGWFVRGVACAVRFTACIGVSTGRASVLDLDWNAAHDPAAPLPRFITHHYIALADVESLSKFRSGYGHVFSDECEAPDRSMKHYIAHSRCSVGATPRRCACSLRPPAAW